MNKVVVRKNDTLQHFGVKGMKWDKKKDRKDVDNQNPALQKLREDMSEVKPDQKKKKKTLAEMFPKVFSEKTTYDTIDSLKAKREAKELVDAQRKEKLSKFLHITVTKNTYSHTVGEKQFVGPRQRSEDVKRKKTLAERYPKIFSETTTFSSGGGGGKTSTISTKKK